MLITKGMKGITQNSSEEMHRKKSERAIDHVCVHKYFQLIQKSIEDRNISVVILRTPLLYQLIFSGDRAFKFLRKEQGMSLQSIAST